MIRTNITDSQSEEEQEEKKKMMMAMAAATMLSTATPALTQTPKSIPGSHGLPVLGPLKDRLDYFWFQGPETFFKSRMASHNSTVFRTNLPPTFPFFLNVDPRVVAVLDCSSFSSLFDLAVVEKRNVLIGDYMPSLSFTGNTRVVVYLDPSEPKHTTVKNFCMDLLKRSSRVWSSSFLDNADAMLASVEKDVAEKGKAGFLVPLQRCIFGFLTRSLIGADVDSSPEIKECGFAMLDKWLALQLLPTTKVGAIPQPLEELLLHSFPFPFFLVSGDYKKLFNFVQKEGREVIEIAKEYGLQQEEAIHNILFVLGFNAFGGFSVFFPSLLTTIGRDKNGLQRRLREEVRRVLSNGRELGFETVAEMELVRSTVYEVLRLNPPVPMQYARAKKDFVLNSHKSSYQVKKGELLCGYQPLAMRDPEVYDNPEEFIPDRFMGSGGGDGRGKELLNYLFWSNGPETGTPTASNKQCAAKDHVVWTACMMVARIFSKYDLFEVEDGGLNVVKLEKATSVTTTTTD